MRCDRCGARYALHRAACEKFGYPPCHKGAPFRVCGGTLAPIAAKASA